MTSLKKSDKKDKCEKFPEIKMLLRNLQTSPIGIALLLLKEQTWTLSDADILRYGVRLASERGTARYISYRDLSGKE